MKIDRGTGDLFVHRTQAVNLATRTDSSASFAAALAGKTQEATGNTSSAPATQVEKYDFSNMTPQALHETVSALIQSGQMNLDETSSLLGMMPSPLSNFGLPNYDGKAPAASYQTVNFFAKIQEGIEGALSRNEKQSAESLQRAANALLRFQGQVAKVNVQT